MIHEYELDAAWDLLGGFAHTKGALRNALAAARTASPKAQEVPVGVDSVGGACAPEVSDEAVKAAVAAFREQVPGRGYEADLRDALTAALPYLPGHKARPLPIQYLRQKVTSWGHKYSELHPNERKGERRSSWSPWYEGQLRRTPFSDRRQGAGR